MSNAISAEQHIWTSDFTGISTMGVPTSTSGPTVVGLTPAGSYLPGEGQASIGPMQPSGASLPPTVADDPITTQPAEPETAAPAAPALPIVSALTLRQTDQPGKGMPGGGRAFGATWSDKLVWTGLKVQPTVNGWVAQGELLQVINCVVLFNQGPNGQVDITGVDDADITAKNYVQVADNLLPDSSGRAPRSKYFCSDLSLKHELSHVDHHYVYFKEEFDKGVAWLNGQTADTAQQAQKLVERMRRRVESNALLRLFGPGLAAEEDAAYAAGRAAYQQRSDDIRAKGKAGGYP
jgi:hypothetical protein